MILSALSILILGGNTLQVKFSKGININQGGQGFIEFALVLPLLLLIVFGALDLGRVFHAAIALTNSAREGARYSTLHPDATIIKIAAAVRAEALNSGLDFSSMTISRTCWYDGSYVDTLLVDEVCQSGYPTRVTVSYDFTFILGGFFGFENIVLDRYVEMFVP